MKEIFLKNYKFKETKLILMINMHAQLQKVKLILTVNIFF